MRLSPWFLTCGLWSTVATALPDHHELEASLLAQPQADSVSLHSDARFPGAPSGTLTY